MNKMKLNKLKVALQRLLVEYSELTTDKGIIYYYEDEFKKGINVFIEDENQDKTTAEPGEYETETFKFTVAGGCVSDIVKKEIEYEEIVEPVVEPEPTTDPEPTTEPEPEPTTDPEPEPEPTTEPEPEPVVDERDTRITELEGKVTGYETEIEALKARIAELEAKPQAVPPQEEFEQINKFKVTGNPGIDNLGKQMSAGFLFKKK